MKNVRTLSAILFYITRIVAILYILVTFYSIISILTEWSFNTKENGKYFSIYYPFTDIPFLIGENNWGYILFNFLIPIGFYGLFFLLVSNVFNVFKQQKLFTRYGVNQLNWFYLANFFVLPVTIFLATIFTGAIEEGLGWLTVIHFILGVFAYFLAAIFKQGLSLQNEQDLFI